MEGVPVSAISGNYCPSTTNPGSFSSENQVSLNNPTLRGTLGTERKIEEQSRASAETAEKIKTIEGKIVGLQRVAATQNDDQNKMQRDFAAMRLEVNTLKQEVEQIKRSVLGGAGASQVINPENLTRIFTAVQHELNFCTLKIAENDINFRVLETTNYDGNLTWKITEFAQHREDARKGKTLSLYSQPFYTARYGYKMFLRIYLNGDGMGKNTHISLFFCLMKGEYDAVLPFPFRKKVTLMLLSQDPRGRAKSGTFLTDLSDRPDCFQKPTTDMNRQYGSAKFISLEELNGSSYVKDDTIFVRAIVVDPED